MSKAKQESMCAFHMISVREWFITISSEIFGEIVDYLSIIGAVEVWLAIILQAFCIQDHESEATPFDSNGVKKLDYDSIACENADW